ncbi:methyltransferase, putative [Theileria annulata]|uniref:2-methoxy-6-polyprenyl-1,4-benzoquinol methylase, mitochondrial n=1 Tax=Theileria annulata TaxID=5874 RepID=Q4U8P0_THEAN|nr:methyltransferase, putative [Theileria annulata]CAI76813.1 methyltransferase, putative [Theileria annulata]|eukprot:XP_953438.1 methyltransferase, putative [Theileria annulata]
MRFINSVFSSRNIRCLRPLVHLRSSHCFQASRSFSSPTKEFVRSVFSDVAKNYDLMNDLMSVGIHRFWKEVLVQEVISSLKMTHRHLSKDYFSNDFVPDIINIFGVKIVYIHLDDMVVDILDLAGGTGDIGIRIAELSKNLKFEDSNGFVLYDSLKITPKIVVCDPSEEMTKLGQEKSEKAGVQGLSWVNAEAEKLPFEDCSFDIITIGFGVRNFSDRNAGLSECYRVLKPGGRLLILEFSHCENELLSVLYKTYSDKLIPFLGSVVAKNEEAYDYLVDSIRKFPNQQEVAEILKSLGFLHVSYRNLTGGIVCIHSGFRKL